MTESVKIVGGLILAVLAAGAIAGAVLARTARSDAAKKTIANLNARVRAWWIMAGLFAGALWIGFGGVIVLFAFISFLALREMITLSPTRRGDHRTLFWAFFVGIPLQYYLLWLPWYGLFSILIPVYGFLFLAIRSALAGDVTHYMERAAKIYWSVMISVYCLSHVPALMLLYFPGYGDRRWEPIAFLVIVAQMSDVMQYVWGKSLGRHKVAPNLSPNKTWEGLVGGVLSATLLGALLHSILPLNFWQAGAMSFLICVMGFFGGLVASAIKRDAGVKDFGHLIEGHGGMIDRVDSLAFAAPVFFHVLGFCFATIPPVRVFG